MTDRQLLLEAGLDPVTVNKHGELDDLLFETRWRYAAKKAGKAAGSLSQSLMDRVDRKLAENGIDITTTASEMLLAVLHGGPASLRDLCTGTGLSLEAVCAVLNGLEQAGRLEKRVTSNYSLRWQLKEQQGARVELVNITINTEQVFRDRDRLVVWHHVLDDLIISFLRDNGPAIRNGMSARLSVSPTTLHRRLTVLAERGKVGRAAISGQRGKPFTFWYPVPKSDREASLLAAQLENIRKETASGVKFQPRPAKEREKIVKLLETSAASLKDLAAGTSFPVARIYNRLRELEKRGTVERIRVNRDGSKYYWRLKDSDFTTMPPWFSRVEETLSWLSEQPDRRVTLEDLEQLTGTGFRELLVHPGVQTVLLPSKKASNAENGEHLVSFSDLDRTWQYKERLRQALKTLIGEKANITLEVLCKQAHISNTTLYGSEELHACALDLVRRAKIRDYKQRLRQARNRLQEQQAHITVTTLLKEAKISYSPLQHFKELREFARKQAENSSN